MIGREPLLSPDWYRVASLRPRLRPGVTVSRQRVRGAAWYVLSDPLSGRHYRFNDIAYALLASCNGSRTLDEIWAARVDAEGDDAPTQVETIRIVGQALAANLFVGDVTPDAAAIVRAQDKERRKRLRSAVNPFAFRVPLWNPDAFLEAHRGTARQLFSANAIRLWWPLAALGMVLFAINAESIAVFARQELGIGRVLLAMWLAYPVIKLLHELAHALAVKAFGGDVHEIGISVLMLTPVPYVDASASVAFADKRKRIIVAAAGIMVEIVLATIALAFWLALEPGLARDLAFAVFAVGGVSTLLVNGNPLLRFDGYFVLCDAFELPNLAARSNQYWQELAKRGLLRMHHLRPAALARGERPWLLCYAPLSWLCRAALTGVLAVVLGHWYAPLGLLVIAIGLWSLLAKPAIAASRWAASAPEIAGHRARAGLALTAGIAAVGLLLVAVPVPHRTYAPAIVWLPDDALVRLGSDGFLASVLVADGADVAPGTPIARLENEALEADLARVEAEIERLEVERAGRFEGDALRVTAAEDALARFAAERERLVARVGRLVVRAAVGGRVAFDARRSREGQYLGQGHLIAHILPPGAPLVRVLVSNEDGAAVRELLQSEPRAARVSLAHAGGSSVTSTLLHAVPNASTSLPTAALGERAGGSIAVDAADAEGRTARTPRFQFDLALDGAVDARIGARALVTFLHADASLAELISGFVRRSFLRYFAR